MVAPQDLTLILPLRRALTATEAALPKKAPPLQLQEWLSGSPQNLGTGSHLVLNFVQEATPRLGSQCPAPYLETSYASRVMWLLACLLLETCNLQPWAWRSGCIPAGKCFCASCILQIPHTLHNACCCTSSHL